MDEQTGLNRAAQAGYEAYAEFRDWRAFDGSTIPDWSEVREEIQVGWEHAVLAIMESSA